LKTLHFFTRLIAVSLLCGYAHSQTQTESQAEAEPQTKAQAEFNCPAESKKIGLAPPNGTQIKCVNEQGERHGPFWMWYSNGQMMQALHFKNGLEHGKQKAWFPNGNIMMKGVSIEGGRNKGFKYFNYYGEPVAIEFKAEQ
tara:strand:+ start:77379 stop:77801 length:423 start_codon:yes stop_codon:yes gene_type:complete